MCDWTKRQWRWIIHIDIRGNNRQNINMSSIIAFEFVYTLSDQKRWSWIEPFKFQFKAIDFDLKVERCAAAALSIIIDF